MLWGAIGCQLVAWGYFSAKAGKISDRAFLLFTGGMMFGQIGAGIETFALHAWGAFTIQAYFLIFTFLGGVKRYRAMRRLPED